MAVQLAVAERVLGLPQLVDLGRALVDDRGARVAEVALDPVLGRVAVGAEDLDREVGGLERRLGRVPLRQRRLACVALPFVLHPGGLHHQQLRGLVAEHHRRDHVLNELVLPIGCPNVSRSRAYSTERSRQARITPTAPAATVKRPWSSPYMAISNPWPSSPIRFSAGTSTFSKKSSPVEPAQTPSLCSVSAVVKPAMPCSSTNAEMPLCFASGSVLANTSAWSATEAYEIQFFWPFRT